MGVVVREYSKDQLDDIRHIWNYVVEEGNAFPQTEALDRQAAEEFFAAQSYTGVALDGSDVAGMYILHPNNIGRCGHIANASYAVNAGQRGKGIGEALVKDSLRVAKGQGFRLMQFNAVVAANFGAIRLYKRLGFQMLGSIPGGFKMPDGSYEDIILFYIEL